jgi:hypothetical protein
VQWRGNEACELDRRLWLVLPPRRIQRVRLFALSLEAVWLQRLDDLGCFQGWGRITEPQMGWAVRLPLQHRWGWCCLQLWRRTIVVCHTSAVMTTCLLWERLRCPGSWKYIYKGLGSEGKFICNFTCNLGEYLAVHYQKKPLKPFQFSRNLP